MIGTQSLKPFLAFQKVEQRSAGLNRVHADYSVADLPAETERLKKLGATLVREFDVGEVQFNKFTDPEGNQFDVTNQQFDEHRIRSLGTSTAVRSVPAE
jgi:Glyoxalase-like domain